MKKVRRQIAEVETHAASHVSKTCLVPRDPLHFVPRHPLHIGGGNRLWNPALDDRRALGSGVEFPDEGRTVEHHQALFDADDLYPLAGQRLANVPLLSLDVQLALAVHFQHPRRVARISGG